MSSFNQAIENITPEIYQNLKLAIEIGKWPDGRKLTQEQKELCLQAVIAWELQNLPRRSAPATWARSTAPRIPTSRSRTSCSSRTPCTDGRNRPRR